MQITWRILFIFIILLGCSKPNNIGLEIQPPSDIIRINQSDTLFSLDIKTVRLDSINSDKIRPNLIIGDMTHNVFGDHNATIATQFLLASNNIDLGDINNLVIEDVYLTYECYDYYPNNTDLDAAISLSVFKLEEDLSSDSIYFSKNDFNYGEELSLNTNIIDTGTGNNNTKIISIQLKESLADDIFNQSNTVLVDNESFLSSFKGLFIKPIYTNNTMLYLNPYGNNSRLRISYHNNSAPDSTLVLDFILDDEAQRVSSFKKDNPLIETPGETYLQSMAGYSAEIRLENLTLLRDLLKGEAINKAIISFTTSENMGYEPHNNLSLLYVKQDGFLEFLPDYFEGETHFGGVLNNNTYSLNITRYIHELIQENPDYTNILYLRPKDVATFDYQLNPISLVANQTILENNLVEISIIYSKLK
ncbi:MAG: DUF4270 family protein [Bacteroidota bacterium]|nr:DUF4270 family protein [Bacteroidota bacterium]